MCLFRILAVCPSLRPSCCLSVCLSVCLLSIGLSIYVAVCLSSNYLSHFAGLSTHLCILDSAWTWRILQETCTWTSSFWLSLRFPVHCWPGSVWGGQTYHLLGVCVCVCVCVCVEGASWGEICYSKICRLLILLIHDHIFTKSLWAPSPFPHVSYSSSPIFFFLPFIPFIPFLLLFSCLILAPFILPRVRFLPAHVCSTRSFHTPVTRSSHIQLATLFSALTTSQFSLPAHNSTLILSPPPHSPHDTVLPIFIYTHLLYFSRPSRFPFPPRSHIQHPQYLGSEYSLKILIFLVYPGLVVVLRTASSCWLAALRGCWY